MALVIALTLAFILRGSVPSAGSKKKKLRHKPFRQPVNKNFVQQKWREIKELRELASPAQNKAAVIEADKLLNEVLSWKGYTGSIGDKLKVARAEFSDYQGVWEAHKFRNNIVHDLETHSVAARTKDALAKFEKAFKDLGVL